MTADGATADATADDGTAGAADTADGVTAGWLRVRLPLDRVVALILLVLLAPVMLAAAVSVRRHDGGPAFIRLRRVGRGGECFMMWKLRTMTVDGQSNRAGGSSLSTANDARTTPVGARLRRMRLDELPQLLNVVQGQMSLIGPRPEDPEFVDAGDARWRAVLRQPPGIAGLTQVLVHDWEAAVLATGDREATYRERVLPTKLTIDQWYVANARPGTDLLVMAAIAERFTAGRQHTIAHRRALPQLPPAVSESLSTTSRRPPPTPDSPAA